MMLQGSTLTMKGAALPAQTAGNRRLSALCLPRRSSQEGKLEPTLPSYDECHTNRMRHTRSRLMLGLPHSPLGWYGPTTSHSPAHGTM